MGPYQLGKNCLVAYVDNQPLTQSHTRYGKLGPVQAGDLRADGGEGGKRRFLFNGMRSLGGYLGMVRGLDGPRIAWNGRLRVLPWASALGSVGSGGDCLASAARLSASPADGL